MSVLLSLLPTLRRWVRSRAALQLEVLALRHQLQVLQRARPPRLRLTRADRLLWVWLFRVWNDWRTALVIVKPETVITWHRRGFRLFWTWKSRRIGRPTTPSDVRALIRTMSQANPLWGAPRIHGELLKLGIDICQATVAIAKAFRGVPRFMKREQFTEIPTSQPHSHPLHLRARCAGATWNRSNNHRPMLGGSQRSRAVSS